MAKTKENLDKVYLSDEEYQKMQDEVRNMRANGSTWADTHRYVEDNYRNPRGYWSNPSGTEFYTLADQERTMLSEGAQQQAINAMSKSQSANGNNSGAHNTVEQIRRQDAAYSGGSDGSAYNILPGQYSMPNVGNMSSRYQYTDPTSITDTVMQHYQDVPSIYDLYSYQDTPDYYADVDLNIPKVADANYKDVHFDTSKITDVGFNRDGIDTDLRFDSSNIGRTSYNPEGIDTDVQFNPEGINRNVGNVSDRFQYEKAPQIVDNYANVINNAADAIANRAAFQYNPDNDPLFAVYQKQYAREGDRAAANALANAAMLSGGQASTAAIAASQQAQNYYGAQMADKIPELYQIAYGQYQDEGENLRRNVDMYRALRSDDYGLQEANRDQHNYDQQFLYNIALQDLAQENANNQMAFNIADTQRQQANINNNLRKAIADTNLSNDQWNEQMAYNIAAQELGADQWNQDMLYQMALQDMYADEFNNNMRFNIADTERQQGNIDNDLLYRIASADASNALSRAGLQINIADGRSSNYQNDRSTQLSMAQNEQGRIADANDWWRNLALDDEAQRQFGEQQKFNIATADIAQENANREAKYNVWNDNYNRQLGAADLLALAGDYSRYGSLYGLTDDEVARLNALAELESLSQGSGGGSSGGGRSSGRRRSGSSKSGSSSTYNGLKTSNQHDLTQDLSDVDWLRVKGYGRLTPSEVANIMADPSKGNNAGKIYESRNKDGSLRYTTTKGKTVKSTKKKKTGTK